MIRRLCALMMFTLALAASAYAVEPDEMLQDAHKEARARAITQELRCVVCQNQSVDDSNAPLAHDIRVLVRERIAAGDTDEQVIQFMVARYGNFILLRPPFQWDTLALWLGPAIFLLIGLATAVIYFRRRKGDGAIEAPPLSPEEENAAAALVTGESAS
jgi:cytochrome c-type biogenesis protein CcmH